MSRSALVTVSVAALLACCRGFHMGAPETACKDMTPGHGYDPQQGAMPYTITISNTTLVQGGRMTVSISRSGRQPFKGFFVQARLAKDPSLPAVGRFFTRQHSRVSCGSSQDNAITHADSKQKEAVTLLWQSPADLHDDLVFRVTVVQNYRTFWVGRESDRVRVSATGLERPAEAGAQPAPTTGSEPAGTTEAARGRPEGDMADILTQARRRPPSRTSPSPSPSPPTTQQTCTENCQSDTTTAKASRELSRVATVYDTCLLSKGCFTLTAGCIERRNCDLMVTYSRLPTGAYRIQLFGKFGPNNYLAFGLSRDSRMGEDAVIYCTSRQDGGFQVLHAYNVGQRAIPMRATSRVGPILSEVTSEYQDGFLLCEFTHAQRFHIRDDYFDVDSDALHVMVASGTASADLERRPQYHYGSKRISKAGVQLASSGRVAGDDAVLLKAHGAQMLVAWLGTASVGIILARYYKKTWTGRKLAGLDAWFHGHRTLMVITVLLSLSGFACILYQLGGWTSTPIMGSPGANPHPLLGAICIGLAVVQPLMAMCRCHPSTPRRPIFNWLHWLVGSTAQLLGIATIFFAVALPAAQLPFWTYWILVGLVGLYVLTHLLLSTQQCVSDRTGRQKTSTEAYSMRDMGHSGYGGQQTTNSNDAPGSGFRRVLLGVYILSNMALVTLLVVMVVLAPADSWGTS